MKIKFNAKSNTIAAYCIIVFAICLILTALIFKYDMFFDYFKKLMKIFAPITWGFVIAYLVNPIMKFIEKYLNKILCKKKQRRSLVRAISITASLIILLGIIVLIIISIVPEIINNIKNIFSSLPIYLSNLRVFLSDKINSLIEDNPELGSLFNQEFENIQDMLLSTASQYETVIDNIDNILITVTDSAWSFVIGLKDCFIGIVISIYLLFSKETFIAQAKKAVYAMFSEKRRDKILAVAAKTNYTFINFLGGKVIDSFIIGVMAFIGLNILGIRSYAVLLSVIIGVTNIIPFFGPFIGAIPCGLLILLTDPGKTLIFVIFIFALQQFDGNILGPKILGNSLKLSTFWIIFAILVGGGLFGFIGMVAFIPLFAVFLSLVKEFMEEKLRRKKLPVDTEFYKNIDNKTNEKITEEKNDKQNTGKNIKA